MVGLFKTFDSFVEKGYKMSANTIIEIPFKEHGYLKYYGLIHDRQTLKVTAVMVNVSVEWAFGIDIPKEFKELFGGEAYVVRRQSDSPIRNDFEEVFFLVKTDKPIRDPKRFLRGVRRKIMKLIYDVNIDHMQAMDEPYYRAMEKGKRSEETR